MNSSVKIEYTNYTEGFANTNDTVTNETFQRDIQTLCISVYDGKIFISVNDKEVYQNLNPSIDFTIDLNFKKENG